MSYPGTATRLRLVAERSVDTASSPVPIRRFRLARVPVLVPARRYSELRKSD